MEHESLYTFGSLSEEVHNDCGSVHYTMPQNPAVLHICMLLHANCLYIHA